jgi:tRNA threonylcarbamoyladenosine modification (KEOPS) complex Cgi121 subunit
VNLWLEEFHMYLTVAGFRNVRIRDIEGFFQTLKNEVDDTHVQLLDASLVAGYEHLQFAVLNALNAFAGHVGISSNLAIEVILYASAQRQIKEAFRLIGLQLSTRKVAVVVLARTEEQASRTLRAVLRLIGGQRDDRVIDLTEDKLEGIKKLFGISSVELESKARRRGLEKQALVDLVIEHMALLVTQR